MSQTLTQYGQDYALGQAGEKADSRDDLVLSYAAEAAIPFGKGVKLGTDPEKQVLVMSAAGNKFAGVALYDRNFENGATGYAATDTVSVLVQGAVRVEVTSDVAAGADAYVDIASGGDSIGKFTDVSTSNSAKVGIFRTAALSGGIAVLEISKEGV